MLQRIFSITFSLLILITYAHSEENYESALEAAHQALEKKDYGAYMSQMQRAVELKPDKVSLPYYQYGLARAYAYNDRIDDALHLLRQILKENQEAPIVFLSEQDPAFASIRNSGKLFEIIKQARSLAITITPVASSVFMIQGAGCNLAALNGPEGVLLVDTGYPRLSERVEQKLRSDFGPQHPVRIIINTHDHVDHTGGNGILAPHATTIAHANVISALKKPAPYFPDFSLPPVEEKTWPRISYQNDLTIQFNGEAIKVIAMPAHTDNDSIVYFTNSRVLHMGDNYFPETTTRLYPGEQPETFFRVLGAFLASLPPNVMVLSGHAPPVPVDHLKKMFGATEELYLLVKQQLQNNKSLNEIKAAAEKQGHPARWVEFYYNKLKQRRD